MTNKLKDLHPILFEEIVHELYEEDFLNKLTFGSGRKLEWECRDCLHRWIAVISDRTRKGNRASGCPKCKELVRRNNISKAVIGKNDLKSCFPEIFEEIDIDRNNDINIETLKYGSAKKVWWKCIKCNNSWYAGIAHRTSQIRSRGCPQCANITRGEKSSMATIGVNDLKSTYPELYEELHLTKNVGIDTDYLSYGSIKKVWWRCSEASCGNEWRTSPLKRTWQDTGCPRCCESSGSSKQEEQLYSFIVDFLNSQNIYDDVEILQNDRSTIINPLTGRFLELDIYIPSLNIAFEYNGRYWHNDENIQLRTNGVFKFAEDYHVFKSQLCEDIGISLIHVFEDDWMNDRSFEESRIKSAFL